MGGLRPGKCSTPPPPSPPRKRTGVSPTARLMVHIRRPPPFIRFGLVLAAGPVHTDTNRTPMKSEQPKRCTATHRLRTAQRRLCKTQRSAFNRRYDQTPPLPPPPLPFGGTRVIGEAADQTNFGALYKRCSCALTPKDGWAPHSAWKWRCAQRSCGQPLAPLAPSERAIPLHPRIGRSRAFQPAPLPPMPPSVRQNTPLHFAEAGRPQSAICSETSIPSALPHDPHCK